MPTLFSYENEFHSFSELEKNQIFLQRNTSPNCNGKLVAICWKSACFRSGSRLVPYPPHYKMAFAFSGFSYRHAPGMPCGYPCHDLPLCGTRQRTRFTLLSINELTHDLGFLTQSVTMLRTLSSGGINCPCNAIAPRSITLPLDILSRACHFPFWLDLVLRRVRRVFN